MEEIRAVALAYYANSSDQVKEMAQTFFSNMDADGDGKISVTEFENYLNQRLHKFKPELYSDLDSNGDGFLDFEEVIVFFYMVRIRNSFCDACGGYLKSTYFTCVKCFMQRDSNQTYDLCLQCYKRMEYSHEHGEFLDNHGMLNSLWSITKKKVPAGEVAQVAEAGVGIASNVVGLAMQCCIM